MPTPPPLLPPLPQVDIEISLHLKRGIEAKEMEEEEEDDEEEERGEKKKKKKKKYSTMS